MNRSKTSIKECSTLLFEQRWRFLFIFLGVFFVTFSFLSSVGFVPESVDDSLTFNTKTEIAEASEYNKAAVSEFQKPLHITIPSVGIDVNVENPQSRDIVVLDEALKSGAVNYPGTGTLTDDANIFLFGHSSFLPNIINKNYQAFNNLSNVSLGDEIFVDSQDVRYVYRVVSVELSEAQEITIDLRRGIRKLTLSTCNSFGDAGERYIVEADFVGSYLLST